MSEGIKNDSRQVGLRRHDQERAGLPPSLPLLPRVGFLPAVPLIGELGDVDELEGVVPSRRRA